MHRHQQRDDEAGGPGRGRLDTRKRSWKGPDGSVVDKRPRLVASPAEPLAWTNPGLGEASSSSLLSTQVVSPPVSDEGRFGHEYPLGGLDDGDERGDVAVVDPLSVENHHHHQQPSTSSSSSSSSSSSASAYLPRTTQYDTRGYHQPACGATQQNEGVEYHPVFQPDTASSFNMPYTTALDYTWLFNLEAATTGFGFGLTSFGQAFQDHHHQPSSFQIQNPTPESQTNNHRNTNWPSIMPEDNVITPTSNSPRRAPAPAPPPLPPSMASSSSSQMNSQNHTRPVPPLPPQVRQGVDGVGQHVYPQGPRHASHTSHHHHHPPTRGPERPLSTLQVPALWPQIDNDTRQRLLDVIEAANPALPDTSVRTRDHPLLSAATLQGWLDLFFTHFNTTYPLLHVPTFAPRRAEPLLLLAVLLLGATYADKAAHQVAVCVHDVMRPAIFAHAGFSPRPALWALQAVLLVECFGKSRAGQRQHDVSHLFHGLLINLIRRSDCQSVVITPQPAGGGHGDNSASAREAQWTLWAESEQKKRLALLCFLWDTQHAVLFCQSLCMSAFELRCAMPCDQNIWEAPDADTWATNWYRVTTTPLMFLPTLKSYLSPTSTPESGALQDLNAFSLVLVLHGIMSIAWDMQRRDQTSLGVINSIFSPSGGNNSGRPATSSWRYLLSDAYDRWKLDFDTYCTYASSSSPSPSSSGPGAAAAAAREWLVFGAAYRSVYHAAQALLHIDFLDIQIYAGARHILGRPVQQQDYIRSSRVVKKWASSSSSAVAAWHAARMLYDIVTANKKNRFSQLGGEESSSPPPSSSSSSAAAAAAAELQDAVIQTNLFHVPWCLYLATLTCWAFHHARPGRGRAGRWSSRGDRHREEEGSYGGDESDTSDEMVWDPRKEMEALVRNMAGNTCGNAARAVQNVLAGQDRRGTNGLVWVVADLLSKVRWGIVHAGVVVLRGLVPNRLINQYETV